MESNLGAMYRSTEIKLILNQRLFRNANKIKLKNYLYIEKIKTYSLEASSNSLSIFVILVYDLFLRNLLKLIRNKRIP